MSGAEAAVERHCREIDRCNQRGGRMLSIVDLLDAGTVDRDLAAYLLAAIRAGASFVVGALPGGAGKTTVMGALLNLLPDDVEFAAADGLAAIEAGIRSPAPRRCFICHEIGDGPYYAYLWGEELRRYFALADAGHLIATNLHADTYEETRDQVCGTNGVAPASFARVNVLVYLEVLRQAGGWARSVSSCWESDGAGGHRPVFGIGGATVAGSSLVPAEALARGRATLERILASGARTTREVRLELLAGG